MTAIEGIGTMNVALSIVNRYSNQPQEANLSCGSNLDLVNIQPTDVIIDLGSGRGNETIKAAQIAVRGKVFGIDITPKMLDAASNRAKDLGVPNAKFILGSLDRLPFDNDFADLVISNCAINHVKDKARVYCEIFRVLKTGGQFVVSDIMSGEKLPDSISEDPEAIAACFGGAIPSDEYFESIRSAGFSQVEILRERHYMKNGFGLISRTLRVYK